MSNAAVTAFVDDLSGSAPLDIRTCTDLGCFKDRITEFVSLFVHTLHKRGMILNCKPGKSAIMISISGQNSKAANLWLDQLEGFLTIIGCRFQIVRSYKLLGGMIDAQGSLGPEVHSRYPKFPVLSTSTSVPRLTFH